MSQQDYSSAYFHSSHVPSQGYQGQPAQQSYAYQSRLAQAQASQPQMAYAQPQMLTLVDPFVVQTLQSVVGSQVVVQTTKDSVRGIVQDVKPDHVVIHVNGTPFFVRIQEIIWIMPTG
jgi:hypothetical protein